MAPPARQSAGWKPIAAVAQGVEAWLEGERDQIALWLPVGLGVGIGAWFGLADRPAWAAFLLLATKRLRTFS